MLLQTKDKNTNLWYVVTNERQILIHDWRNALGIPEKVVGICLRFRLDKPIKISMEPYVSHSPRSAYVNYLDLDL